MQFIHLDYSSFATLLSCEPFLPGVLALGRSLQSYNARNERVVLVTEEVRALVTCTFCVGIHFS